MDLPAILRRAPELGLIDELAHTNAPGVEHHKRCADLEDVLAAGIDVYSTVNIQHLESLNDQVAELTGTRVRETIPDSVVGSADDVVLIDITPASLIERLLAGKVYPAERVQAALNNFFKIENLSALRDLSLRQAAEEVEAKRIPPDVGGRAREERMIDTAVPQAIGERLMALITPTRQSQRVARRAWRSAQRLGADLDLLWVADHEPSEEEQHQIDALRSLASVVLGAHLLIEHGVDVATVVQRVAQERGTTYVLMGTPKARGAIRRLSQPALPIRLLALLPDRCEVSVDQLRRAREVFQADARDIALVAQFDERTEATPPEVPWHALMRQVSGLVFSVVSGVLLRHPPDAPR
jgi:two-component system, OmpR family, sensor histidine kinase KdpD